MNWWLAVPGALVTVATTVLVVVGGWSPEWFFAGPLIAGTLTVLAIQAWET